MIAWGTKIGEQDGMIMIWCFVGYAILATLYWVASAITRRSK